VRKALVYAMRIGDRLVLNMGRYSIDFINEFTCPVNFPTNLIFNFKEWRKEENYKRIVRQEEDVDLLGNKKCYFMNDNFTIIILHDIKDVLDTDDKREEVKEKIPHYNDHFDTFFVSRFMEAPKPTAPKPVHHFIGGPAMHTVSFSGGNVTHNYHQFDYADIYDPQRGQRKGCGPPSHQ
jgi:hypothetical protein